MNNSKNGQFHIPFIKSLVIMGLVTMVSMISARYFINYSLSTHPESTIYTSSESQISTK